MLIPIYWQKSRCWKYFKSLIKMIELISVSFFLWPVINPKGWVVKADSPKIRAYLTPNFINDSIDTGHCQTEIKYPFWEKPKTIRHSIYNCPPSPAFWHTLISDVQGVFEHRTQRYFSQKESSLDWGHLHFTCPCKAYILFPSPISSHHAT